MSKPEYSYKTIYCPICGSRLKEEAFNGEADFRCSCGWHVSFIRVDENNVIPV
jgi:tRNA(Ile2) C34 agmatinyltransferase TiaS